MSVRARLFNIHFYLYQPTHSFWGKLPNSARPHKGSTEIIFDLFPFGAHVLQLDFFCNFANLEISGFCWIIIEFYIDDLKRELKVAMGHLYQIHQFSTKSQIFFAMLSKLCIASISKNPKIVELPQKLVWIKVLDFSSTFNCLNCSLKNA